ncbi:hypothetical protein PUN28_005378 [Cardiocondyla obscurior]|uniref:Uncharacterized protein n=1 Tax=Cardiocondyla obscurior TaxID=286306 RepID=A0AAW2GFK9_9HYME
MYNVEDLEKKRVNKWTSARGGSEREKSPVGYQVRLSHVIKHRIVGALDKRKPIVLSGMEIRMTRLAAAGDNPTEVQQDSVVFSEVPWLAT